MNRKINTVYFKNGLEKLELNAKSGSLEVLEVVSKINNLQLQCNDVKDIIENLIVDSSVMGLNYNDIKSVLLTKGGAFVAICYTAGERAITKALYEIISSFKSYRVMKEETKVLLNIVGNKNIGILEVNQALSIAKTKLVTEPEVFLSITVEDSLADEVYVVAIVTGL